ncbi:MAG: hypothetical protein RLY43_2154 [Bacteroidota bacterium]|jgi:hypothetical protein
MEIFEYFRKQYEQARMDKLNRILCYENAFNMTVILYKISDRDMKRILAENQATVWAMISDKHTVTD